MSRASEGTDSSSTAAARILTERRGHVLVITINRAEKRNAADLSMLRQLASAYGKLENDPELRVGLVQAAGEHFTGGLDLADLAPALNGEDGLDIVPEGGVNPFRTGGAELSKPVIVAVRGYCLTWGMELILAADTCISTDTAQFGQLEVSRGILAFGGATLRLPRAVGWGNAMRWLLTGQLLPATEAHRIGLVQELVPSADLDTRAFALAESIAAQAPLAVQATLRNARAALHDEAAAAAALPGELGRLLRTEDARLGLAAFATRSEPRFLGR